MGSRTIQMLTAAAIGVAALAVAAPARADSSTIVGEPIVVPGHEEFGNSTGDTDVGRGDSVSYWGLPVIAGDHVSIAYSLSGDEVDAFNLFAMPVGTRTLYNVVGLVFHRIKQNVGFRAHGIMRYVAPQTGTEPLAFAFGSASEGPYDFTATVRHRADMRLPGIHRIARHGTLHVQAHDPDGKPLTNDKLSIAVQYEASRHHWQTIGRGHPRHGVARVAYSLPARLAGHTVDFRARASGGGYFTLKTGSRRARVS